jgi:anti-anti-sigma factor
MINLKIELYEIQEKIVLELFGRIDAMSISVLDKKIESLVADGHKKLILDFSNIDYLSSAGLRLLLSLTKKLKKDEGFLVVFGMNPDVMEIINIAGFEKVINICQSQQQAISFS